MRYRSAIIGLGQIGQGYDYPLKGNSRILTHATALKAHSGFELVAGVDPNKKAREDFTKKFEVPAYDSLEEMLAASKPEVVTIAVPTKDHYSVFSKVVEHNPKGILLEKPIAAARATSEKIVDISRRKQIILQINYFRRFLTATQELKEKIKQGVLGEIYKGVVWYSKGIQNNGSHYIDLLSFLFDTFPTQVEIVGYGETSFLDGDPEPDLKISFGDAAIYFLSNRESSFSAREMRLVGTKGVLEFTQGGEDISLFLAEESPVFGGYRFLGPQAQKINSDFAKYQYQVLEALHKKIAVGSVFDRDLHSALETARTVEGILTLLNGGSHGEQQKQRKAGASWR